MYGEIRNITRQDDLNFDDELLLAEKIGKGEGHCDEQYSDCVISIVDIFSAKYIA